MEKRRSPISARRSPTSDLDLSEIERFEHELETVYQYVNVDRSADVQSSDNQVGGDDDVRTYNVSDDLHNKRIDAALAILDPALSRSHCGSLVARGCVRVMASQNATQFARVNRKSFKIESGMTLEVTHPRDERPTDVIAQDLPLTILFEDEHMIVLNKAANTVVHPAAGNWDGTVVNALAYYLTNSSPYGSGDFVSSQGMIVYETPDDLLTADGTNGETVSFRPGVVHRLDKGTTGVLVIAKTKMALAALSEAFATRTVKKTYLAMTVGNPGKRVVIDKPIGRHPVHRQRMRVVPNPHRNSSSNMVPKYHKLDPSSPSQAGRRALSFVDTMAFDGKLSFVQVRIETGRTHQIRVHLQDRRTPIYGDAVYGIPDWNKKLSMTHQVSRPLLHAYRLELNHPVTSERMVFIAPMAEDMLGIAKTVWPDGPRERPDLFFPNEQ